MPKTRPVRLRRIHLKISFLETGGLDEDAFHRIAMVYDPMPVGAMGHLCLPDRQRTGHGVTFTFVYADEMEAPSPNKTLVNAHRRMH